MSQPTQTCTHAQIKHNLIIKHDALVTKNTSFINFNIHTHEAYLKDEERGPSQGGYDEEHGAQKPIPARGIRAGAPGRLRRAVRIAVPAPNHLHYRPLVKRHQHRARDRHQRPRHLRLAPHLLHVQFLHPICTRTCNLLARFKLAPDVHKYKFAGTIRPEYDGHHEGHRRQDVAHRAGESRGRELQSRVVKVLVYNRPENIYTQHNLVTIFFMTYNIYDQ